MKEKCKKCLIAIKAISPGYNEAPEIDKFFEGDILDGDVFMFNNSPLYAMKFNYCPECGHKIEWGG